MLMHLFQMLFGMLYANWWTQNLNLSSTKNSFWIVLQPILSLSSLLKILLNLIEISISRLKNSSSRSFTISFLRPFITVCTLHIPNPENLLMKNSWEIWSMFLVNCLQVLKFIPQICPIGKTLAQVLLYLKHQKQVEKIHLWQIGI